MAPPAISPGKEATIPAPVYAEATRQLRTSLELAALDSAVPCARLHARHVVQEWGLDELRDTVELLVSELVTNAVQASRRLRTAQLPVVGLSLACDQISVVIQVWDASDDMPLPQRADPDDGSGRGLMIIETLSSNWGAYRKSSGKVVWAQIAR